MENVKLFHSDVFMPYNVPQVAMLLQKKMSSYRFTRHLNNHLDDLCPDRSHNYSLGKSVIKKALNDIKENPVRPFEVELTRDDSKSAIPGTWHITKYVIRVKYDSTQDIAIVIRPSWNDSIKGYDFSNNLIVTAWLNATDDDHKTLDFSKYCNVL